MADQLIELVFEQIAESWDEWREGLSDRMAQKSQYWNSEHNPVLSQDKLIRDYTNQFIRDLSTEIDEWGNKKLKEVILKENLKYLDTNIAYELDAIQGEFNSLDQNIQTNFSKQLKI
uniref:Dynamin family protein n=1 Tax=Nostoc flagelliforme str. Sunitezuoqi TaxID=676037 RepID=E7DQH6_9NOSO|nr:dynamin family protein [Nostoc flagelliforme str. Sunitezuoqi]